MIFNVYSFSFCGTDVESLETDQTKSTGPWGARTADDVAEVGQNSFGSGHERQASQLVSKRQAWT